MNQRRLVKCQVLREVALYQLRNGAMPIDVWAMVRIVGANQGLDDTDFTNIQTSVYKEL